MKSTPWSTAWSTRSKQQPAPTEYSVVHLDGNVSLILSRDLPDGRKERMRIEIPTKELQHILSENLNKVAYV